jgi:hypothetical protein
MLFPAVFGPRVEDRLGRTRASCSSISSRASAPMPSSMGRLAFAPFAILQCAVGATTDRGGSEMTDLIIEPVDIEALLAEITRYLAAVEALRAERYTPCWR